MRVKGLPASYDRRYHGAPPPESDGALQVSCLVNKAEQLEQEILFLSEQREEVLSLLRQLGGEG